MIKHIINTIYKLKRRYGQTITLTRLSTLGTYDYTDGTQSGRTIESKIIKKAVVLPARGIKTFSYDLAFIAANKNFTYGGYYDKFQRTMIIDQKDIGTFDINLNTVITIKTKKYGIKELHEYEEQSAILLIIIEVKGNR